MAINYLSNRHYHWIRWFITFNYQLQLNSTRICSTGLHDSSNIIIIQLGIEDDDGDGDDDNKLLAFFDLYYTAWPHSFDVFHSSWAYLGTGISERASERGLSRSIYQIEPLLSTGRPPRVQDNSLYLPLSLLLLLVVMVMAWKPRRAVQQQHLFPLSGSSCVFW